MPSVVLLPRSYSPGQTDNGSEVCQLTTPPPHPFAAQIAALACNHGALERDRRPIPRHRRRGGQWLPYTRRWAPLPRPPAALDALTGHHHQTPSLQTSPLDSTATPPPGVAPPGPGPVYAVQRRGGWPYEAPCAGWGHSGPLFSSYSLTTFPYSPRSRFVEQQQALLWALVDLQRHTPEQGRRQGQFIPHTQRPAPPLRPPARLGATTAHRMWLYPSIQHLLPSTLYDPPLVLHPCPPCPL